MISFDLKPLINMAVNKYYWMGHWSMTESGKNLAIKQDIGFQLDRVQRGKEPENWKPMTTIGQGVKEIRTKSADGVYRTIYTAKFKEAVYVLHAFQKKTQKTPKSDIDLAQQRFKELTRRRDNEG